MQQHWLVCKLPQRSVTPDDDIEVLSTLIDTLTSLYEPKTTGG